MRISCMYIPPHEMCEKLIVPLEPLTDKETADIVKRIRKYELELTKNHKDREGV